jgi:hypothetical protein
MCGHDPRVIETSGDRLQELFEVGVILHDTVDFFNDVFDLLVECGYNTGLLVLVLDDMPLISDDVPLYLSSL